MPSTERPMPKTTSNRVQWAALLLIGAMSGACDRASQPADAANAPKATAGTAPAVGAASGVPKTLSLAMFCTATAQVLKGKSDSGLPQADMQRVQDNALQFALQEAKAQNLPSAELDRQTSAVVKLATRKLLPADQSDAAIAKAKAELQTLAAQVKSDCLGTF
jgi:hypothetical protein